MFYVGEFMALGTHHKFHFKLLVVEVGMRGDRLRLSEPGAEVYL